MYTQSNPSTAARTLELFRVRHHSLMVKSHKKQHKVIQSIVYGRPQSPLLIQNRARNAELWLNLPGVHQVLLLAANQDETIILGLI